MLIVSFLILHGYTQSAYDPCLFYGMSTPGDHETINIRIYVFVDDFIVTAPTTDIILDFRSLLKSRFGVKDIGPITKILGMHAIRDIANGTTTLSQTAHIEQMLAKFGLTDCKGCLTPAVASQSREDNKHTATPLEPRSQKSARLQNDPPDIPLYQSMVGSLMWVAECTRPDIKFAVGRCARKMTNPTTEDVVAAKRIMRYLSKTKHLVLKYSKTQPTLIGYADADWGGHRETRRSTTGYVFYLAGAAISAHSSLQKPVALSSCEAEYYALSASCQEAVFLRALLDEGGLPQRDPTIIREDNQGCIAMTNHKSVTNKSKHIAIKFRFASQCVQNGAVKLSYVKTNDQLADILTKPLEQPKFSNSAPKLLGMDASNSSQPSTWMSPSFDEMSIRSREADSFGSFKAYVAMHNSAVNKCVCHAD